MGSVWITIYQSINTTYVINNTVETTQFNCNKPSLSVPGSDLATQARHEAPTQKRPSFALLAQQLLDQPEPYPLETTPRSFIWHLLRLPGTKQGALTMLSPMTDSS